MQRSYSRVDPNTQKLKCSPLMTEQTESDAFYTVCLKNVLKSSTSDPHAPSEPVPQSIAHLSQIFLLYIETIDIIQTTRVEKCQNKYATSQVHSYRETALRNGKFWGVE